MNFDLRLGVCTAMNTSTYHPLTKHIPIQNILVVYKPYLDAQTGINVTSHQTTVRVKSTVSRRNTSGKSVEVE